MSNQRRRDTTPEMALRRELFRRGLRYRVDQPVVPGTRRRRVDIVFPSAKVAIFVDGCFWHGCPQHGNAVLANGWYWPTKIENNCRRDADSDLRLIAAGWTVIRVWEHEAPVRAADRIEWVLRTESDPDRAAGHSTNHELL